MTDPDIGRYNTLRATASTDVGMLLDGGVLGDVLLPNRYVPEKLEVGDTIEIFLSNDSEDRLVATTEKPFAQAGEFAALEIVSTTHIGAFLDWGMPKDLFLPFGEQVRNVSKGERVLVCIVVDPANGRLLASTKLNKFVEAEIPHDVPDGAKVSLIIAEKTDLGTKAIVDDSYWGLLPSSLGDAVPPIGERCTGYIGRVREGRLCDLALEPPGYKRVTGAAGKLAEALSKADGGFLPVHDKSPPERVRELLGMSKKVFKQALGTLYRDRKVRIESDGIYWVG